MLACLWMGELVLSFWLYVLCEIMWLKGVAWGIGLFRVVVWVLRLFRVVNFWFRGVGEGEGSYSWCGWFKGRFVYSSGGCDYGGWRGKGIGFICIGDMKCTY